VSLLLGLLLNAIASISVGLLLFCGGSNILALVVKDVTAQVEAFSLCCGGRRGGTFCGWEGLSGCNSGVGAGLEGLQTSWSIGDNAEVTGEWRSDIRRTGLRINLILLAVSPMAQNEVPRTKMFNLPGS
jgi:hypothetical protein